jgi:bifunctional enzyme CysN/CysC
MEDRKRRATSDADSVEQRQSRRPHGSAALERADVLELLRFATAGSVDDGKSTLIGRLLYDSKQVLERPAGARRAAPSERMGRLPRPRAADRRPARRARAGHHDRRRLPLLRDAAARFIIADTPGHEQYTRNMVTGASTADLAIVLIDARKGVSSSPSATRSSARCCGSRIWSCASTRWTSSTTTRAVFDAIVDEFDASRRSSRCPT